MLQSLKYVRVVLVDDDPDDREFFQEVISELPYEIELTVYKNGQEFLNGMVARTEGMPDLVFLDLNMPVKNGKDALRELRSMDEFKNIPVIAIYSTSTSDADQAETLLSGADAFISKPTDYGQLKKLISKIFEMDWKNRNVDRKNFVITPL
jgi:CheY-like chemotaxis protein